MGVRLTLKTPEHIIPLFIGNLSIILRYVLEKQPK